MYFPGPYYSLLISVRKYLQSNLILTSSKSLLYYGITINVHFPLALYEKR